MLVYLDDIFVVAPLRKDCEEQTKQVRELLALAWLLVNGKKCVLPSQQLECLGIVVDFVKRVVSIATDKCRCYEIDLGKLVSEDHILLRAAWSILEMRMTDLDPNENDKFLIFVSMKNLENCFSKN